LLGWKPWKLAFISVLACPLYQISAYFLTEVRVLRNVLLIKAPASKQWKNSFKLARLKLACPIGILQMNQSPPFHVRDSVHHESVFY
jgi:hypothetical protein